MIRKFILANGELFKVPGGDDHIYCLDVEEAVSYSESINGTIKHKTNLSPSVLEYATNLMEKALKNGWWKEIK